MWELGSTLTRAFSELAALVVRWVDLLDDPARLEVELAKAGATTAFLERDLVDVPELRAELKFLRTKAARLRRALEWFGDEGHPQPKSRTRPAVMAFGKGEIVYGGLTPDWGPLPRLDADERPEGGGRKGGRPSGSFVDTETFWAVWEMALNGMSGRAITKETEERADLKFVNRHKVAIVLRAVAKNPSAARRALGGRKIPRGFSSSLGGVRLPRPEPG